MTTSLDIVNSLIVERFASFVKSERLAHAYFFSGSKGIGKFETALAVAKLVNCEDLKDGMFCDACSACLKINNSNHPDIHVLEDNGESIKIDDIRLLIRSLQFRSFEARIKVFLIQNAQRLTIEASNALLKTLEEPSRDSLIILTTSMPERLLETIRSRCQAVHFFSLANAAAKKELIENQECEEGMSHFLAYFSDGCLVSLDKDYQDIFDRKNKAINEFVFEEDSEPYFKVILSDKNMMRETLRFLFLWFKDLMMIKSGVPQQYLANIDRVSDLKYFEKRYCFEEIEEVLNDIVVTQKAIDENFNIKVPLAIIKEKIWKK
ncbi:MAG: DNA polymerase III subunit delta' [Candidatus Omnitrophica bacterium]|nr:DNA polymerase III subunit delta' [Candidatus Omnitrophota bacterium]